MTCCAQGSGPRRHHKLQPYLPCSGSLPHCMQEWLWLTGLLTSHWQCFAAGMFGCGTAATFQHLLAWRWVTGIGSALQMAGAQLFLADISQSSNRARSLGINQVSCLPGREFLLPSGSSSANAGAEAACGAPAASNGTLQLVGDAMPFCLSDASLLTLGSSTLYILQAHAVQAASLVGSLLGPTIGGFLAEMAGLR